MIIRGQINSEIQNKTSKCQKEQTYKREINEDRISKKHILISINVQGTTRSRRSKFQAYCFG